MLFFTRFDSGSAHACLLARLQCPKFAICNYSVFPYELFFLFNWYSFLAPGFLSPATRRTNGRLGTVSRPRTSARSIWSRPSPAREAEGSSTPAPSGPTDNATGRCYHESIILSCIVWCCVIVLLLQPQGHPMVRLRKMQGRKRPLHLQLLLRGFDPGKGHGLSHRWARECNARALINLPDQISEINKIRSGMQCYKYLKITDATRAQ